MSIAATGDLPIDIDEVPLAEADSHDVTTDHDRAVRQTRKNGPDPHRVIKIRQMPRQALVVSCVEYLSIEPATRPAITPPGR